MTTITKTLCKTIDICGYKVTAFVYPADPSVGINEVQIEIDSIKLGGRHVSEETFESMREGMEEDFLFALQDAEHDAMDHAGDRFEEGVWA